MAYAVLVIIVAAVSFPTFVQARGGGNGLEFLFIGPATFPLGWVALHFGDSSGLLRIVQEPSWLQLSMPLIVMTTGGLLQAWIVWLLYRLFLAP
ncbi:hypothetical protein ACIBG8_30440 [Nonomuraea sp. NPDC050556]|uniref:hypothetical protein n=1 Tax=Nonomuraea sp. NPDC050556 TaxID=3364369 RepID=UPI0037BD09DB